MTIMVNRDVVDMQCRWEAAQWGGKGIGWLLEGSTNGGDMLFASFEPGIAIMNPSASEVLFGQDIPGADYYGSEGKGGVTLTSMLWIPSQAIQTFRSGVNAKRFSIRGGYFPGAGRFRGTEDRRDNAGL